MDQQLGALFDLVRNSEKLRENTMILVCSDNGPEVGFGSAGPFRGSKATLFEGGIRSSLVVWAPGLMKEAAKGTRNHESVFSAIDLVPSLLAIADVPGPESTEFDGENVADALLGNSSVSRKAPLFFRRPPDRENFRHFKGLPDLAVRSGNWKLLCDYDGGNPALHGLAIDPGETTDVATANPEVVHQLTNAVLEWHQAMPADRGPELGAR